MGEERLDYPALVREALRGVVRQVLRRVSEVGLPGEHHFFLTFRTGHPDAALPPALRKTHPEEMTIVLQHQFTDLVVTEEAFSVTLRFDGVPRRLTVPFAALTGFLDPAGPLGLQFEPAAAEGPTVPVESEGPSPAAANVVDLRAFRKK